MPGFKPNAPEKWDSGDFSDGCIRNSMSCSENDMFFPVFQKTWDNPNSESIAEDDSACKKECLSSCDCKAYVFEGNNDCIIFSREQVDLQEYDKDYEYIMFVRVATFDIGTNPFHTSFLDFTVFKIATTGCFLHPTHSLFFYIIVKV